MGVKVRHFEPAKLALDVCNGIVSSFVARVSANIRTMIFVAKHVKQDEASNPVNSFLYLFPIKSKDSAGASNVKIVTIVPADLKAVKDVLMVKELKGSMIGVHGGSMRCGHPTGLEESSRLRNGSKVHGEVKAVVGILAS